MFRSIFNVFNKVIDDRNAWLNNTKNIPNPAIYLNEKKEISKHKNK